MVGCSYADVNLHVSHPDGGQHYDEHEDDIEADYAVTPFLVASSLVLGRIHCRLLVHALLSVG